MRQVSPFFPHKFIYEVCPRPKEILKNKRSRAQLHKTSFDTRQSHHRASLDHAFDKCPHLNLTPGSSQSQKVRRTVRCSFHGHARHTAPQQNASRLTDKRQQESRRCLNHAASQAQQLDTRESLCTAVVQGSLFFFVSIFHSGTSSRQAVQPPSRRRGLGSGTNVRRCCSGIS